MDECLNNISDAWINLIFPSKEDTNELIDIISEITKITPRDKICPPISLWFEWARYIEPNDIKIIIIAQDPYPRLEDAHGLAFSSLTSTPASLKNIYKCLENHKLLNTIPKHGCLTTWAKQGVLMLNMALSTEIGIAGKHIKLWKKFTKALIKRICDYHYDLCNQLIFFLWGGHAQKLNNSKIIDADFHIVMEWLHPSPLAQASAKEGTKFINCNHFTEANAILFDEGIKPIKWNSIESHKISKPVKSSTDIKNEKLTSMNIKNINPCLYKSNTDIIQVFTDASCYPNKACKDSKCGYGIIYVGGIEKQVHIGSIKNSNYFATNQRGEGYAILSVFKFLKKLKNWEYCQIYTDSEFWVNMITTYMPSWEESDFEQKKNTDITKKLNKLWNKLNVGRTIELIHVYGHNKNNWRDSDDPYKQFCFKNNDIVDKLAGYARLTLQPGKKEVILLD